MNYPQDTLLRPRERHAVVVVAFALLCLAAMHDVAAEGRTDPAGSVTVSYKDLDLSTPQGVGELYQRIRKAARIVCKAGDPMIGLYAQVERTRVACIQRTVDEAVAGANVSSLTALHGIDAVSRRKAGR